MRKQIIENAAFELATKVREVEDVIDTALGELAELQSRLVRRPKRAEVPVVCDVQLVVEYYAAR